MKKYRRILYVICTVLFLSFCGCSVPSYFYIRNQSAAAAVIRIHYLTARAAQSAFTYGGGQKEPDFNAYRKYKDTLYASLNDDSLYTLRLPAHSTLLLNQTSNFANLSSITSLLINDSEVLSYYPLYPLTNNRHIRTRNQFFNRFTIWYEIEPQD